MKYITTSHGEPFMKRYTMLDRWSWENVFRRTHWLFGFIPVWTRLWRVAD